MSPRKTPSGSHCKRRKGRRHPPSRTRSRLSPLSSINLKSFLRQTRAPSPSEAPATGNKDSMASFVNHDLETFLVLGTAQHFAV